MRTVENSLLSASVFKLFDRLYICLAMLCTIFNIPKCNTSFDNGLKVKNKKAAFLPTEDKKSNPRFETILQANRQKQSWKIRIIIFFKKFECRQFTLYSLYMPAEVTNIIFILFEAHSTLKSKQMLV